MMASHFYLPQCSDISCQCNNWDSYILGSVLLSDISLSIVLAQIRESMPLFLALSFGVVDYPSETQTVLALEEYYVMGYVAASICMFCSNVLSNARLLVSRPSVSQRLKTEKSRFQSADQRLLNTHCFCSEIYIFFIFLIVGALEHISSMVKFKSLV